MNGALSKLSRNIHNLSSCLPRQYSSVSRCCFSGRRTISPLEQRRKHYSYSNGTHKISSVNEAMSVLNSNSLKENVALFSELSENSERGGFVGFLNEMCESPSGLSAVLDMRDQCNTMIRALPEPRLLKFDRVLFEVLSTAVRYDTTEIATVTKSSSRDILDLVARSDRVHPIGSEEDLQHRIADNRSVFILTHTLLPGRPLVALHVAHSRGMFQCVSDIKEGMNISSEDTLCRRQCGGQTAHVSQIPKGQTAGILSDTGPILSCLQFADSSQYHQVNTFYSISSLEIALRGIPCGGWCISKAKCQLTVPNSIYTTLSPIPGFRNWCDVSIARGHDKVMSILGEKTPDIVNLLSSPHHVTPPHLQLTVSRLAAYYLLREKQRGAVLDPVGHFHVTNGAVVWGLRWGGKRSVEMMEQSLGLMVNYLYDGEAGERAARYASDDKEVTMGAAVSDLLDNV